MPVITSIDDLRRMHRAHTPRMFYDYAESGSYTEQTFRENTTDFAKVRHAGRHDHRLALPRDVREQGVIRQLAGSDLERGDSECVEKIGALLVEWT